MGTRRLEKWSGTQAMVPQLQHDIFRVHHLSTFADEHEILMKICDNFWPYEMVRD